MKKKGERGRRKESKTEGEGEEGRTRKGERDPVLGK